LDRFPDKIADCSSSCRQQLVFLQTKLLQLLLSLYS